MGSATLPTAVIDSSLIFRPASWVENFSIDAMFGGVRPLEVELGSGDGSFLGEWAAAFPDRNFLGVERLLGRLRKLDRRGRRAGLTNLRLMRIEAAYFLEYLLPPASVHALHVYFPDPWPKRKQRKHRLINERFPDLAARSLISKGRIYVRTDDATYFEQMQEVFAANRKFDRCEMPTELVLVTTDFERAFQARGVKTLRMAWQLV